MTKQNNKVVTRFAPSPTGDPHIGSLRNALYNWLYARQSGGRFILRIEDTDQARYQAASEQAITEMLDWTGLDFDEKIIQSQRRERHQQLAAQLVDEGKAYKCFCAPERLEQMRKKQQVRGEALRYDRRCRAQTKDKTPKQVPGDMPYVIRLKIPETGETQADDLIRGTLRVQNSELDDFIILKSDGYPTYHLAHVIDDHDSDVTHVIRSEEWLPSLPKHKLLYEALGFDPPVFAHLPLILATDKSKLSKRHGATGVLEFRRLGYLPEALLNYVLLLGWHPKKGSKQELFTREEMLKQFKLEEVQKSGAVFDYPKLDSMSGLYIRQAPTTRLAELAKPFFKDFKFQISDFKSFTKAVALEKDRVSKLSDLPEALKFIFALPEYDPEILVWKKSDKETAINRLNMSIELINEVSEKEWDQASLESKLKHKIESENLGAGETLWPLRVALAGQPNSPGPFEMAEVLGKAETLGRLRLALAKTQA